MEIFIIITTNTKRTLSKMRPSQFQLYGDQGRYGSKIDLCYRRDSADAQASSIDTFGMKTRNGFQK